MLIKTLVLTAFLGLIVLLSSAQSPPRDSVLYSTAAVNTINYFNANIGDQSEIYSGDQYDLLPPANKGTFYFQDKNFCTPSLICFNAKWHKDIPVLYDVYNDVIVSVNNNYLFVLKRDKLSDVFLLGHHFVYFDPKGQNNMPTGFYDELYDGRSKVLVKRIKTIFDHQVSAQFAEIIYEDHSTIYLKKGDKFLEISSKGNLKDALADKKKQINEFMRANKINFNKDKEGAVAKVAGYYDQISN
ncbi:MAG: hypothetical protein JST50_19635 [Bacteroidetes bacterium]|jgi:hypothetical protein|nr:hypothetical protein [Bacteroidota bacterium]